jgi:tetratricopeptide (TPR) repeat protein
LLDFEPLIKITYLVKNVTDGLFDCGSACYMDGQIYVCKLTRSGPLWLVLSFEDQYAQAIPIKANATFPVPCLKGNARIASVGDDKILVLGFQYSQYQELAHHMYLIDLKSNTQSKIDFVDHETGQPIVLKELEKGEKYEIVTCRIGATVTIIHITGNWLLLFDSKTCTFTYFPESILESSHSTYTNAWYPHRDISAILNNQWTVMDNDLCQNVLICQGEWVYDFNITAVHDMYMSDSSLPSDMKKLFETKIMSDFEIVISQTDERVAVHKAVLWARAPALIEDYIIPPEFDPNTVQAFLCYLYTGQISGEIVRLYDLAVHYDIKRLMSQLAPSKKTQKSPQPENVNPQLEQADKIFFSKQYFTAHEMYTKLIHMNKEDALLYARRSVVNNKLHFFDKALNDIEMIIQLTPDSPDGFYRKAMLLMEWYLKEPLCQQLVMVEKALSAYVDALLRDTDNLTIEKAMKKTISM